MMLTSCYFVCIGLRTDEPSKKKIEGRRRLCKAQSKDDDSDDDHVNLFSGITDFDSPPVAGSGEQRERLSGLKEMERPRSHREAQSEENELDDDNIPSFAGITDFDTPEEEKQNKVKIEGKRRLCKLSHQEQENVKNKADVQDEPTFSAITDFDSPLPSKSEGKSHGDPNAGDIRDILNDLSSKLDLLSIEKKKEPRQSGNLTHGRAESSTYGTSQTSKVAGVNRMRAVDEGSEESTLFKWHGDDHSVKMVDETKETHLLQKENDIGRAGKSLGFEDQLSDFKFKNKEESYRKVEPVRHTYATKNELKSGNEKLRYAGRSYMDNLRNEVEDDEDDCVVVSGKNLAKESRRRDNQVKPSTYSQLINLCNDDSDDKSLEDEGAIILSGSRYTYKLPGKISTMLFPHQREGLRWLWSLHCQGKGGILGDDMGLGKTMQICGFLAGLFHSKLIKRALVVAPKTLLDHWIKELSIVNLSRETKEYFGTSTKARQYELQHVLQWGGILLTTYDIVRNNSKALQGGGFLADHDSDDGFLWDYMILDEGHLIKNPSTQRAKSLLEIECDHCIVVSGTPIQNNLKELWALFNFCCPDLLGDKKWFKEKYEDPILRGNDKHASDRDKHIGSRVAKELRERIQPYFLRRLKSEVFNEDDNETAKLSKKNEIIVWLRLTACQRQLYEAFLQSELVLSAFDGSPLAAITILKKICDHPLLLTKRAAEDVLEGMETVLNPEDAGLAERLAMHVADIAERNEFQEKHDNISCKISFIMSLLDDLIAKGHRVLIFSQTRKMLDLIQASIGSSGYKYLRIDGTTKSSDRVKTVNEFQDGSYAPIFLLTSQVGGLGLTLTKADRVIVADPAWNPSTDNQSVDRAYRIGQKKDVIVYRLMTCGTVEEKIYRKQIYKGGLFKTATEQKEQVRYFSKQDLRDLFSLPKDGFDVSLTQRQLHEEHDKQHKMEEALEAHIKFLETKGIAGVSHHSLLFSKTAPPVPVVDEDDTDARMRAATMYKGNSSRTSQERDVDGGAEYAFNPKDVDRKAKSPLSDSPGKLTESDIKSRVNRLTLLLGNRSMVSGLPDKGEKLRKQIGELNMELEKMRVEKELVDLDDLTEELEKSYI
ncbi:Protein CHROMATIN REMODELING 24 [Linum perenne]